MKILRYLAPTLCLLASPPAVASVIKGTVYAVGGNSLPSCRSLIVKNEADGNLKYFRVPDTGADNSILSLALFAFSTNGRVEVWFVDGDTTGCGTEPKVQLLRMTK